MTQDMVTDQDNGTEPEEKPTADEQPPLPPTGWDPYTPPARPVAPTGWDPYSPPVRSAPVTPAGWDPYTPPVRTAPVLPMGWDPYAPPARPVMPTGWDPYQPPHNGTAGLTGTAGTAGAPVPAPVPVPHTEARPASVASAGGWVQGASITHLWSASESPGVWIAIHGIGWRLLSSASDSGHSHLVLLALLARTHRLPVAYHEDSRGHIDQLLV
ncbi:hypothetical protein [Saccharomonospora cyanea]|uniref:Uncharacterized protein n=1 Tax=Saccharomonospora cyanea NA-134 TaxID=882082 RepID=H5XM92_9PSEU|nr:hypothetical protein [Saccharomonospora cyanea]EHR63643.1 hypothetical protein SaccyDRAFT_4841 [Saccharomonospora cyanea NA-134]